MDNNMTQFTIEGETFNAVREHILERFNPEAYDVKTREEAMVKQIGNMAKHSVHGLTEKGIHESAIHFVEGGGLLIPTHEIIDFLKENRIAFWTNSNNDENNAFEQYVKVVASVIVCIYENEKRR